MPLGEKPAEIGTGNFFEDLKPGESGKFELLLDNSSGKIKDIKVFGGCSL